MLQLIEIFRFLKSIQDLLLVSHLFKFVFKDLDLAWVHDLRDLVELNQLLDVDAAVLVAPLANKTSMALWGLVYFVLVRVDHIVVVVRVKKLIVFLHQDDVLECTLPLLYVVLGHLDLFLDFILINLRSFVNCLFLSVLNFRFDIWIFVFPWNNCWLFFNFSLFLFDRRLIITTIQQCLNIVFVHLHLGFRQLFGLCTVDTLFIGRFFGRFFLNFNFFGCCSRLRGLQTVVILWNYFSLT